MSNGLVHVRERRKVSVEGRQRRGILTQQAGIYDKYGFRDEALCSLQKGSMGFAERR